MIIKENQLNKIILENQNFLCLLFYGPNEGLIREQIKKVSKYFTIEHDYEEIGLNSKDLDEDSYVVESNLRTVSMFSKGKVLTIESLKEKHLPIIESVIDESPQNSALIIKAESLTKSSKVRRFFENHKLCFSLACYEDDTKELIKQIEDYVAKNNLKFDRDVKNYLIQNLSSDRMINNNELEKMNLFIGNSGKLLSIEDAKFLLNDSSTQNFNRMIETVMYGNTSKSSKIVNKLLSEGTNPVSLVRSLINYLSRIQKTKIEMKKGNNFDTAIKDLKPPIFWKEKESFQRHCLKWPLKSIEKNIVKLLEAEILCKLNSRFAALNCEHSILLIANSGKQYFKN